MQALAEADPQRVVALGSEPRKVQELHDVGSLESWDVVAPALGVKHVQAPSAAKASWVRVGCLSDGMGETVAGLGGAGAADCGTRCSRWPHTSKMGDVQLSSVFSLGSGVEVEQACFWASVLRSASMPRVSVPRVSLLCASASGPLSLRWACDRSPWAHASFPACRALHLHMRLRVACVQLHSS